MSAFVVARKHIAYLVNAAFYRRHGEGIYYHWDGQGHQCHCSDRAEAERIAQVLWAENVASVAHRYPDDKRSELPGMVDEAAAGFEYGRHEWTQERPNWVQVLKACDGYAYQSCEHPGWESSEARAIIEAIRSKAIHALPGYEDAAWEITDATPPVAAEAQDETQRHS
jgi:hypothetical protein